MSQRVNLSNSSNCAPYSAKNRLQEYCQRNQLALPKYNTIRAGGLDHAPLWISYLHFYNSKIDGLVCHKKSEAEASAAERALELIEFYNKKNHVKTEPVNIQTLMKNCNLYDDKIADDFKTSFDSFIDEHNNLFSTANRQIIPSNLNSSTIKSIPPQSGRVTLNSIYPNYTITEIDTNRSLNAETSSHIGSNSRRANLTPTDLSQENEISNRWNEMNLYGHCPPQEGIQESKISLSEMSNKLRQGTEISDKLSIPEDAINQALSFLPKDDAQTSPISNKTLNEINIGNSLSRPQRNQESSGFKAASGGNMFNENTLFSRPVLGDRWENQKIIGSTKTSREGIVSPLNKFNGSISERCSDKNYVECNIKNDNLRKFDKIAGRTVLMVDVENLPKFIDEVVKQITGLTIYAFVGEHHCLAGKEFPKGVIKILSPSTRQNGTDTCMQVYTGVFLTKDLFDTYLIATRDHYGSALVDMITADSLAWKRKNARVVTQISHI